jgi:hypothetical protein
MCTPRPGGDYVAPDKIRERERKKRKRAREREWERERKREREREKDSAYYEMSLSEAKEAKKTIK